MNASDEHQVTQLWQPLFATDDSHASLLIGYYTIEAMHAQSEASISIGNIVQRSGRRWRRYQCDCMGSRGRAETRSRLGEEARRLGRTRGGHVRGKEDAAVWRLERHVPRTD